MSSEMYELDLGCWKMHFFLVDVVCVFSELEYIFVFVSGDMRYRHSKISITVDQASTEMVETLESD